MKRSIEIATADQVRLRSGSKEFIVVYGELALTVRDKTVCIGGG